MHNILFIYCDTLFFLFVIFSLLTIKRGEKGLAQYEMIIRAANCYNWEVWENLTVPVSKFFKYRTLWYSV